MCANIHIIYLNFREIKRTPEPTNFPFNALFIFCGDQLPI